MGPKVETSLAAPASNSSRYYAQGATYWQGLTLRNSKTVRKILGINPFYSRWPLPRLDRVGRIMHDLKINRPPIALPWPSEDRPSEDWE